MNSSVRNHQKHHVEHERQCGRVNGIADRKLFAGDFRIPNTAAGNTDECGHRDAEDGQKRGLAAHVALYLQSHIGANSHADGYSEGKAADTFGDFLNGQNISSQCHGSRTTDRVYSAHIQPNDDQNPEDRKGDESRERKAKQSKEQQINPITVEVVQQIPGYRAEQDGGYRHSGENNPDFGPGDTDLLTVDGNDGDRCVESG